jgi:phosphoglycolate phosphatase
MHSQAGLVADLDGTLLDTAPDMANALNVLLVEEQRAPLLFSQIRPVVSHGSTGLIRLAFGVLEETERQRLITRFLAIYRAALAVYSQPFAGFTELLLHIRAQGLRWGVVTNKPAWLTDPLLAALGLDVQADWVVSGDTVSERKPHPLPLLHAAQLIGLPPEQCVYTLAMPSAIFNRRAPLAWHRWWRCGLYREHRPATCWQADGAIEQPNRCIHGCLIHHKKHEHRHRHCPPDRHEFVIDRPAAGLAAGATKPHSEQTLATSWPWHRRRSSPRSRSIRNARLQCN